jgi:hypothetical protein
MGNFYIKSINTNFFRKINLYFSILRHAGDYTAPQSGFLHAKFGYANLRVNLLTEQ